MKTLAAIALCLMSLTSANAGEDRRVRIINRSSAPIRYFYASNVDRTGWEEDILGPLRIILPGESILVNIDDGSGHCLYDMKAVLYDKRTATIRKFNVCANSSWTVQD
jgi:hypothetical protein